MVTRILFFCKNGFRDKFFISSISLLLKVLLMLFLKIKNDSLTRALLGLWISHRLLGGGV